MPDISLSQWLNLTTFAAWINQVDSLLLSEFEGLWIWWVLLFMYWRRLRIAFEENCGNCPSKSPYIIFNRLFHSIFPKRHFHDLWDLETHCAVIKKEPFQHPWINMVKGMILELYMPLSKNRLNDASVLRFICGC